jgi:Flp pilus assembly protein CpaB
MSTARIVVLTIALSAVGVLVAKSDIGLGQIVAPADLQGQTWPATTASNSFIRRNERPDATTEAGLKHPRGPLRDLKLHDDTEVIEGRPT